MNRVENPLLTGFLKGSGVDTTPTAISGILRTFIQVLILGGIIIFIFQFLLGGIKWITSGGDEAKVKEAREQVTQALIGLVIVFVAFAIAKLIEAVFGVNIQNLTVPSFVSGS